MNRKLLFTVVFAGAALWGCGSGDINIEPSTTVTDSNNTVNQGGGDDDDDVCASYQNSGGQTIRGQLNADGNCLYSSSFSSNVLPLRVDMTIPALPDGGAHIFEDSLFVGESCRTDACLQANGIAEGGDGPTLTIEAGATVAFRASSDFMVINRGSRIVAVGRADAPITFTSETDVLGTVGPEDVQQWGGLIINGFGVTNACSYTGTRGVDLQLNGECHVDSEGSAGNDENQYGGDNDDDSSGQLEYVVVKHTGATVGNGDEINGITFGAVGRNTIVRNLEIYSVYDDGIEMFGGAVNVENYVAVYVRDDSLDFDEGWQGEIDKALIIQPGTDGNQCIEADGLASFDDLDPTVVEDFIARGLNTRTTISNMTCIFSPNGADTATHDPGAGPRFREGIFVELNNSLVIGSFAANDQASTTDNACLRIDNRSAQAATDGDLNLNNVIWACAERTNGSPDAAAIEQFAIAEGNVFATIPNDTVVDPTAANDAELQLLEGEPAIYSIAYATSQVDGAVPGAGSDPAPEATYLGALSLGGDDWTAGWTYGIHPDNRAQPLWFEGL